MPFVIRSELVKQVSDKSSILQLHESMKRKYGKVGAEVFLSHSHNDKELIEYVELLFKKEKAGIYIDHKDPDMPPMTNQETAKKLKQKIAECNRFVMLASDEALLSRWVPWELGFADGKKNLNDVAIFPVRSSAGEWKGSEYIGLYKTIQVNLSGEWFVVDPGGSVYLSQSLKEWLSIS